MQKLYPFYKFSRDFAKKSKIHFCKFANNYTTYHMKILFSFIFLTFLSFFFFFFETEKGVPGGGGVHLVKNS